MCHVLYIFLLQCVLIYESSFAKPLLGTDIEQLNEDKYPFIVSIGDNRDSDEIKHFCTGTLISNRHVLTSEHCVEDLEYKNVHVLVGSFDLLMGQKIQVESWLTYEEWAYENGHNVEFPLNNDIAVLTLSEEVNEIKPAVLSNVKNFKLKNTEAIVAGWGVSNSGEIPRFMQTARVRVVPMVECLERIEKISKKDFLPSTVFLCTAATPYALIQSGDSGGPLFNDKLEIIGVNDSSCPKIYTSEQLPDVMNLHVGVDYYKSFINDVLKTTYTKKQPC